MAGDSTTSKGKKKTLTDDLFETLNPNHMLNNAQRVLSSAVNILEEEIAAGIVAAKKIEKKIIDVDEVRSNPEHLMNRFRRDTHEVVDIFLDSFASVLMQLKLLSNNIEKHSGNLKTAEPEKE